MFSSSLLCRKFGGGADVRLPGGKLDHGLEIKAQCSEEAIKNGVEVGPLDIERFQCFYGSASRAGGASRIPNRDAT